MNLTTLRSNFRHLYGDIFGYGLFAGSTLAFLAVYAARLGATSFQISLMTGGPAVVNLLLSLPAARWLENRSYIRSVLNTAIAHRLGYLVLIPLPWLLTPAAEIWAILAVILLIAIPGALLAISFFTMFAEVVPGQYRAEVVGKRNALMSISMMATTWLCGELLDRVSFPVNYQLVFGIGILGLALSTYHLWRIRPTNDDRRRWSPERSGAGWTTIVPEAKRSGMDDKSTPGEQRKPMLRLDLLALPGKSGWRGAFGPLMIAYLCFYISQHVPVPIAPLFWVQTLHLTDSEIGAGIALINAMMTLVSMAIPYLSARYNYRQLLIPGALLFSTYPLLTGLAWDSTLYWIASLSGGIAWGVTGIAMFNRLMERVPADDRPAHMAWHNIVLNLGILGGSLLGAGLGEWVGLRDSLLIATALRVVSALALWLWA